MNTVWPNESEMKFTCKYRNVLRFIKVTIADVHIQWTREAAYTQTNQRAHWAWNHKNCRGISGIPIGRSWPA